MDADSDTIDKLIICWNIVDSLTNYVNINYCFMAYLSINFVGVYPWYQFSFKP